MNDNRQIIEKQNDQMPAEIRAILNPFENGGENLYKLMYEAGQRRFGSACRHEKVTNGRCESCWREVI